jgi:hypothetical protein
MKSKFFLAIAMVSGILIPFSSSAQLKTVSSTTSLQPINFTTLKYTDLISGTYKSLSPRQKFASLSRMVNRYGTVNPVPVTQKSGTAPNGVRYFINKGSAPVLPATSTGTTQSQSLSNDLVVCQTTPLQIVRNFAGPLFIGVATNPNQSVIYPGAMFKDDDIVRGIFTPMTLPRKTGSITIDVLNTNGSISETVSNFNDRTIVNNAINALRTETGNSFANTYIDYSEFFFQSSSQFNLSMEGSMDLNLAPIIELPVLVAANNTGNFSVENSLNAAVAALFQVYYTISIGGEGPASTINGTIPSNALCVTDVQYGRIAYITVGSYSSRTEASLVLNELVSVGLDESLTLAEVSSKLSASAKAALSSGFVKIKITGGSAATAVTVSNLETFRNYVTQIDPSVAGSQSVPIYYTLRYAADNSPAQIGAFASFTDEQCFRADQLKVTLSSVKATNVVDFGGEELYGTISVGTIGKIASGSTSFWSVSSSSPKQASTNENLVSNTAVVTFNLNEATTSATSVTFTVNIKDKIMGAPDPEFLGANATDKERGYAQYSPTSFTVTLDDVKKATNGVLNKVFVVEENGAKVAVNVQLQLINQ